MDDHRDRSTTADEIVRAKTIFKSRMHTADVIQTNDPTCFLVSCGTEVARGKARQDTPLLRPVFLWHFCGGSW